MNITYLTVREAATHLETSMGNMYRLLSKGIIKSIRHGEKVLLINLKDVVKFKENWGGLIKRPRKKKTIPNV